MSSTTLDSAIARLQKALDNAQLPCRVLRAQKGPTLTRFVLEPEGFPKASSFTAKEAFLAEVMGAKTAAFTIPLPGTSHFALDIPNAEPEAVPLAPLLEDGPWRVSPAPLLFPLGKDITGQPVICDLAKMPHLLISGVAGSGKTVCLQSMLASLLLRSTPGTLRLILADACGDLGAYADVPHLLCPVIRAADKAVAALHWATDEMHARFQRFEEAEVRNITQYNADRADPLPRIVIVIDSLDMLMQSCARDAEEAICRLAQLGRAAGIHMVIAAQRATPAVITGLIKACIPSRITFLQPGKTESRAILDCTGAESLLIPGDMLYKPVSAFTPTRVQGCIAPEETHRALAESLRAQAAIGFEPALTAMLK